MTTGRHHPLDRFIDQWWRDLDEGAGRTLADYLAMFPGDEDAIAEEYLNLKRAEGDRANRNSDRIGPYRLIRPLGRGGQGTVYLAEDTKVKGRKVALKLLDDTSHLGQDGIARFKLEAEVSSRLRHPGICQVFTAEFDRSPPYIAMQHLEGQTLAACMRSAQWTPVTEAAPVEDATIFHLEDSFAVGTVTPPPPPVEPEAPKGPSTRDEVHEVLALIEKAARALHAAHEAGVVHRDVKPGNIMVTRDGQPVIMDFGLARDVDAETRTVEGQIFGTIPYMAPEQLEPKGIKIDRRADVWALGVTLYECLTGLRPFPAPTREALFRAILETEPEDPRRLNSRLSADLRVVLETALDKDRDRRYQTALDLAEELRRVRELEPITARPASAWTKLKRWAQRKPALAGSLGAGFLAITAGLVVALVLLAERDAALSRERVALARERETSTALDTALGRERKTSAALDAKVTEYDQMSDVALVEDLKAQAETLWPRRPDKIDDMKDWIGRAEAVFARLPQHEAALQRLRNQAADFDSAQRAADTARRRELHRELFDGIAAYQQAIAAKEKVLATLHEQLSEIDKKLESENRDWHIRRLERRQGKIDGDLESVQKEMATIGEKLREMRSDPRLTRRLIWELSDRADQWRHDVLSQMLPTLRSLGRDTLLDVKHRLAYAETIAKRTIGDHDAAWQRCCVDLRKNPRYSSSPKLTSFRPQVGLVPLGIDRESGLWEFWHVDSGLRPGWDGSPWAEDSAADPHGKVQLAPDGSSGIVMVLIPGGTFTMGATQQAGRPNHDPEARHDEQPVHEVNLDAFFLAKHEMTQAQWLRVMSENPSHFAIGAPIVPGSEMKITGLHPVTNVSWYEALNALHHHDLVLPTEARWECACRAGTTSVYWCGDEVTSIQSTRAGNLSDMTVWKSNTRWPTTPELDDDHVLHAPVGSFAPNAFGLHDVLGNVMEWCVDRKASYDRPAAPGDGLRDDPVSRYRAFRGGGFNDKAVSARAASRYRSDPTLRTLVMGVRPARDVR